MQRPTWLILTALWLTPALGSAETRPQLLAMDLKVERGVEEGVARLLNELLLAELERAGRYDIVGGSDLRALVSNEQQKLLAGCTDEACLAEIGGALDTNFIALAGIGRLGQEYLINLKILDVRRASVMGRAVEQIPDDEGLLADGVRRVVRKALGIAEPVDPQRLQATAVDSSTPLLPWVGLGGATLAAGMGGLLLARARSEDSVEKKEYQAYLDAREEDKPSRYQKVERAVANRNRNLVIGWTLVGVGVAGACAGIAALLLPRMQTQTQAAVMPLPDGLFVVARGEL